MESRKRHNKRKITPSDDEKLYGSENHTFFENEIQMDEIKDDSIDSKKTLSPGKMIFNDVTSISEKHSNPLEILANLRTNMEQWKSYACSRRIRKLKSKSEELFSKAPDPENYRASSSGLGLEARFEDFSSSSKPDKGFSRNGSRMSAVSNQALIQYFAKLGQSQKDDETIDLQFVHTLLASGANINCTDKHGQTIMHEVARAWHVDVVKFLIEHGADVNKGDNLGRTPLHVAAAVDYVEMINMLIENNADKEATTLGENQTPVFYAAKTDAVQALKTLILKHGCQYKLIVDYKGRTPIHVAAELDRSETARLLLECEAPVYVCDNNGSRAITWMISKMAPVASEALNQLYNTDRANRKQYFALNYLIRDKEKDPCGKAQAPLQMAVGFKQYDLLMHPVFRHLLEKMWHRFGRFWALYQLGINFIYICMWTIIGILVEYDKRHIYTMPDDAWRIVLYLFAAAFTIYQIFEEVMEFRRSEKLHMYWETTRKADIQRDIQFCHPRWPEEKKYLDMEIEFVEHQKPKYFRDMWNIFDWICYIMLLICIITHVADIIAHAEILARLHIRFMAVTIILLWLRLMKNARAFSILGPFIVMLGHMLKDCLKFLFLYMEFYIPYWKFWGVLVETAVAAFWMTFGGTKKIQENLDLEVTVNGFEYPGQIFFSLFRLTLVDDYDYDNMLKIDSVMADILLSTWFLLSAILCLNLFIALLSDTFQRVYDNAQANAVMQRAIMILHFWEGINQRRKDNFLLYIENNCSPLREEYDDDLTQPDEDDLKKVTIQIKEDLDNFKEMFKQQFGDPRSELFDNENASEGDINRMGNYSNGSQDSVHKFQSELNDLKTTLQSTKTQQESTAALLQKDMKSIKQMLKQLLDRTTTELAKASDAVPVRSSVSEQMPLSKMKKKTKRPVNVGLEIDTLDEGSMRSTTLGDRPQNNTSEFSPSLFQDITHSAQSQLFDVMLSPPSSMWHTQQKPGTDDGSSTNC